MSFGFYSVLFRGQYSIVCCLPHKDTAYATRTKCFIFAAFECKDPPLPIHIQQRHIEQVKSGCEWLRRFSFNLLNIVKLMGEIRVCFCAFIYRCMHLNSTFLFNFRRFRCVRVWKATPICFILRLSCA